MKCPKSTKFIALVVCFASVLHIPNAIHAASTPSPTSTIIYPTLIGAGAEVGFKIDAVVGSLRMIGYTSPNSLVAFSIDENVAGTQISCPGSGSPICDGQLPGYFDKTFTGLYPGVYNIGVYSVDASPDSLSTPTVIRTVAIIEGQAANADQLTLPPTLKVEKITVKRPEKQKVIGYSRPNSNVSTQFGTSGSLITVLSEADGYWDAQSTEIMHLGNNFVYSFVQGANGAISQNSRIINFQVIMSADLNIDNYVDIADFSILMYNYDQSNPDNWAADINDDGFIDLSDFSIMMFNWSPDPDPIPTITPTDTPSPTPTISPTTTPSTSPTPS